MRHLLDVSSDPPARSFALSFDDEPIRVRPAPAPARSRSRANRTAARLASLLVDGSLVACAFAAIAAAGLWRESYPFDALLRHAPLWTALLALVGVAYSFFFVALQGRTPGMAASGGELRTLDGAALTPRESLLRALLAAASAPALFGFALSLFDRRGQALHDKLCGSVVVAVD